MKKLTILVAIVIILTLAYGIPRIMTKTEDESITLSSSSDYTTYTTKPITSTTTKVIETTAKKTTSAIPKTTEVTTTAQTTVATTAATTTTATTTTTQKVEQPIELNKRSLGEFKLTAYCSCQKCCGKWALNRPVDENGNEIVIGSTGNRLTAGLSIAVDPKVIPYGSKVEIYGNTYIAHDTGGAIKGNRIDVYFDSHESALQFGVKHTEVFLLNGES